MNHGWESEATDGPKGGWGLLSFSLFFSLSLTIYLPTYPTLPYLPAYLPIHPSIYLSIKLSIYRSIYLSISLSICLSDLSIYLCLSIYRSIYLSIYVSINLSIYLSLSVPVCLSVYRSIYLSVYLSIDLSISLSVCLSVCLSIYLSVCLSLSLSIYLSISVSVYLPIYLPVYLQAWKTKLFCETSSGFWTWQHQMRSKSERLPQCLNLTTSKTKQFCETSLTTSKTKQFCETSSIFELGNIKNETILRDFRVSFLHFWLRNVLRATTACTFSTSQLPKVLRTWSVFSFFTANMLRATTACNFSSLIWPAGSAPAALASLLFEPPASGATNHWKNIVFWDFPTFSRICIFFLLTLSLLWSSLFYSSLLSDSSHLCFSSVHIVGSLTSKLPSTNILRYITLH